MSDLFLNALVIGAGASIVMDVVALGLRNGLGVQSMPYGFVGRWFICLFKGQLVHRPISASPPRRAERLLGWALHFAVGIAFAFGFLALVGRDWLHAPSLWPAITFGGATVLVPFVILQPCLGFGLAARLAPNPWAARLKSLFTHLVFGTGLWLSAQAWQAVSEAV